jgi:hypothetical protein
MIFYYQNSFYQQCWYLSGIFFGLAVHPIGITPVISPGQLEIFRNLRCQYDQLSTDRNRGRNGGKECLGAYPLLTDWPGDAPRVASGVTSNVRCFQQPNLGSIAFLGSDSRSNRITAIGQVADRHLKVEVSESPSLSVKV